MKKRGCLCLFAVLVGCLSLLEAQSTNQGAIVGTVTDPSGGVVPGANLLVSNRETGVSRTVTSNGQGYYRADFLLPGKYDVSAEMPGFKKAEFRELTLRVGQALRADFKLEVGELTESVTVTAAAAINTETPTLGEVIDSAKIQNLPLNGREFLGLAALVPGAESGSPKRGAIYSKGYAIGFNGARTTHNAYYLDGAASTDPWNNQLISSPALDAIKEFRIETNMYAAQTGRSGGAVISVITNSGTNKYHGTVYEYHRNKVLDALPFFYRGTREALPPYLFNQFGGTVGGPILKDKTFFFVSIEGFRQKKPGALQVGFGPTELQRVGDLSQTISHWTNKPVVLRNPFTQEIIPDSKLPANLISPAGKKIMDLWAESMKPNFFEDPFLNWRAFKGGSFNQKKFLTRVDHNFSEKDVLSGTFNYGNYDNISPGNTKYGDSVGDQDDRALVLTYTHTFSPSLVNDLKFNYTTYLFGSDFLLQDKSYGDEWGLWKDPSVNVKGSPRILLFTVGDQNVTIGGRGADAKKNRHFYFKDALVWVKSKHTVFIGGDFYRQNFNWKYNEGSPPTYYIGATDGHPSYPDWSVTGSTFSSLLTGVPVRSLYALGDGDFMRLVRNLVSGWIQDDWKILPRLTLNLGLRYDYEAPFSQPEGLFRTLNFETGVPLYAKGAPADQLALLQFRHETGGPNRPFEPRKRNFAPRIGFAVRPFSDNRTAIRAGYGVFYMTETAYSSTWGAWTVPFRSIIDYRSKYYAWPDRQDHLVPFDKEPYGFKEYLGRDPGYIDALAPDFTTGYMQQWNFSIARSITKKLALETAYVGSKGTNLDGRLDLGFYPETYAKQRAIFPSWSVGVRNKGYNSKYHSLQLKATQEFDHGLYFLSSFTWGHAMAESSNSEFIQDNLQSGYWTDGDNVRPILGRRYSNADFDVRKSFRFSGGYELPFGRRKSFGNNWNGVTNAFLGGWQVFSILSLQGGYPFTVYDAAGKFPDRVCSGNLPKSQRSINHWFDEKCFPTRLPVTVPYPTAGNPSGTITYNPHGNASPMAIVGPWTNNLDLGIHKMLGITEKTRVQVRLEAFNAFNHPQFTAPSGNVFTNTLSGTRITRTRENRAIQLALRIFLDP